MYLYNAVSGGEAESEERGEMVADTCASGVAALQLTCCISPGGSIPGTGGDLSICCKYAFQKLQQQHRA